MNTEYQKDPAFIESLKRAQEEVESWPKEKRDVVESLRRFWYEQSRID